MVLSLEEILKIRAFIRKHSLLQEYKSREALLKNCGLEDIVGLVGMEDPLDSFCEQLIAKITEPSNGTCYFCPFIIYICGNLDAELSQIVDSYQKKKCCGCKNPACGTIQISNGRNPVNDVDKQFMDQLIRDMQKIAIDTKDIHAAYQKCVPKDPSNLNTWSLPEEKEVSEEKFVEQAINKLIDVPESGSSEEPPALLQFLERLRYSMDVRGENTQVLQVQDIINGYRKHCNIESNIVQHIEHKPKRFQQPQARMGNREHARLLNPPALMIMLETHPENLELYYVASWLRIDPDLTPIPLTPPELTTSTDKPYPLRDIPKKLVRPFLEEAIREARRNELDSSAISNLRIEFFLPCALFDEDVENWQCFYDDIGKQAFPLVVQYQVVIRSMERHDETKKPQWEEKCERMCQYHDVANDDAFYWPNVDVANSKNISSAIIAGINKSNTVIGLGVPFASSEIPKSRRIQLFSSFIMAGIPIAVWWSCDSSHRTAQQTNIQRSLRQQKLYKLPESVAVEQREIHASGIPPHYNPRLKLFWDDYKTHPSTFRDRMQCP